MTVTNVTPPVLSGTAQQGQLLTTTDGTWTFDAGDFLTYTYQWLRCDLAGANCVDIGSATQQSYLLGAADVGHTIRSEVTATETNNPPPPSGTPIEFFSDVHAGAGGNYIFVNRWENDGTNAIQPRSQTSPDWPAPVSGPAIHEVNTAQGDGFLFECDAQMDVASGGKKSEMIDDTILTPNIDRILYAKVMFPAAGNTQGFPSGFNAWNDLIDFHSVGTGCIMGVNTDSGFGPVPSFYFRTVGPGWDQHQLGPSISYDTWYALRIEFKLSSTSSGYLRAYVDNSLVLSRNGQNMTAGQVPYLQFGFYGPATKYNQVYFAGMSYE